MRHNEYEIENNEEMAPRRKNRSKPMELVFAHMNPKELKILDEVQGGRTYIPGTKLPHYKALEKRFADPEFESHIMKNFERHAAGGMIGDSARKINDLKQKGRFGDSELAGIGPNTNRVLDRITSDLTGNKGKNANPTTGMPEYFSIGDFFGGIKHGFQSFGKTMQDGFNKGGAALGNFANSAITHLKDAAPQMLQGALQGGLTGGPEGALMGGAMGGMQGLSSSMSNPHNQDSMSQFAQSPMGQQMQGAASGAYDRYNQGQNWHDNLGATMHQGTQGMDNPYARGIHQGVNSYYGSNGNMGHAFAGGVQGATQGMSNPYMRGAHQGAGNYMQHGNMGQAAMAGMNGATQNSANPYVQAARSGYQSSPYGNQS